jgi:hypothetical protein
MFEVHILRQKFEICRSKKEKSAERVSQLRTYWNV